MAKSFRMIQVSPKELQMEAGRSMRDVRMETKVRGEKMLHFWLSVDNGAVSQ